mmetsp:Transcript_16445/g.23200  ORF Transcript_16445/g.23200 Transcript_16445/m.23200 type:complete len:82 (+) Transcript_16445:1225-1470(+)
MNDSDLESCLCTKPFTPTNTKLACCEEESCWSAVSMTEIKMFCRNLIMVDSQETQDLGLKGAMIDSSLQAFSILLLSFFLQ